MVVERQTMRKSNNFGLNIIFYKIEKRFLLSLIRRSIKRPRKIKEEKKQWSVSWLQPYVELFHWENVILEHFNTFQLFKTKFQLYLSKMCKMFWLTLPSIFSVNKTFAWKMSVSYIHNLLESPSSCANISTWVHGSWSLEKSHRNYLWSLFRPLTCLLLSFMPGRHLRASRE